MTTITEALRYVSGGKYAESVHVAAARCQFEMLRAAGLSPQSRVLEIGGGCLVTGAMLAEFLDAGHYVVIEPNTWLVDAGRLHWQITKPVAHVAVKDFFAGGQFDFIHSHSVLSHAAADQLGEFFAAVKKQLRPGGRCSASIRLGDKDSNSPTWVYPGVTYFTKATIGATAAANGLQVEHRDDLRADMMAATLGRDFHNWIVLTHSNS